MEEKKTSTPDVTDTKPAMDTADTKDVKETADAAEKAASSEVAPATADITDAKADDTKKDSSESIESTSSTTPSQDVAPEVSVVDPEPVVASVEPAPAVPPAPTKRRNYFTYVAVALVMVALVLVRFEREDQVVTNAFMALGEVFAGDAVVATVDDSVIRQSDITPSINQLSDAAAQQGLDPTTEVAAAEIRQQAIDMMVNTELLTAAAEEAGIEVTNEAIDDRVAEIEQAAGGNEVLMERLAEFDISEADFRRDIRVELLIVGLLDNKFAEADLSVSEEEVIAVYEAAGGEAAGAPPLDAVRGQIETQIRQTKEQDVVTEYLAELRSAADITVVE